MRHRSLIPIVALPLALAPALFGQTAAPAPGSPFAAMDANRDGQVTRAEWKGNDVGFAMHDVDGDGVLSGAELTPAAAPEDPAAAFLRLDRDHDSFLARGEWTGPTDDFDRLDNNQDGKVARNEFLKTDRDQGRREGLFRRFDKNRDGRVVRSEWASTKFDRLDTNHDGSLSRDEFLRP
jgi:Ca2+-binding EF-hand superfamily protein